MTVRSVVSRRDEITIESARIIFLNFEGKEGKYNRAGDRNFAVLLPEDLARSMEDDGWNVKYLRPRDDEDTPQPYIQVAVSFKGRPPRIVMITETTKRRTILDEDTCDILDWADIAEVDLTIRPYRWEVNGNKGTKAYLKTIFAIIAEDYLELKYSDWDNQTRGLPQGQDSDIDYVDGEVVEEEPPFELEGGR